MADGGFFRVYMKKSACFIWIYEILVVTLHSESRKRKITALF